MMKEANDKSILNYIQMTFESTRQVLKDATGNTPCPILDMRVLSVGHPVFVGRVLETASQNVRLRLYVHRFFLCRGLVYEQV